MQPELRAHSCVPWPELRAHSCGGSTHTQRGRPADSRAPLAFPGSTLVAVSALLTVFRNAVRENCYYASSARYSFAAAGAAR